MKHRMSNRKPKVHDPSQATISHVFGIARTKASEAKSVATKGHEESTAKKLTSEDPRVQAFYTSLTPREVIAHSIAVEKLGSSYDVTRTHGFVKWCKANPVKL